MEFNGQEDLLILEIMFLFYLVLKQL